MQDLLELPWELQIVLFSGFAGYKVATIGRGNVHRTEELLLQVLAYGTVGRVGAMVIYGMAMQFADADRPALERWFSSNQSEPLIIFVCSLATAIVAAGLWVALFEKLWSAAMERANVYRDDHEATSWRSIMRQSARWHYIQIKCSNGCVYESQFDLIPDQVPMQKLTLNDDGIATYVTRVHLPDGT